MNDKTPSREVQEFLTNIGGKNPYGEPLFRVVWGGSRLTTKMGRWHDCDPKTGEFLRSVVEARQVPKYPGAVSRFVVERWQPAEFYGSPEDWKAATHEIVDGVPVELLGDYPSRGGYEFVDMLADTSGEPIEPNREYLAALVYLYRHMDQTVNAGFEELDRLKEEEEREKRRMADHYKDMIEDNAPVLYGGAHAFVEGLKGDDFSPQKG